MSTDLSQSEEIEYLSELLRASRKSQAWLAEQCGVSDNAVSKWFKTGKISRKNYLKAVSVLTGMPKSEVVAVLGVAELNADYASDPNEYVSKVKGVSIAAGTGEIAYEHEEVDGSHAFKRSWLRQKGIGSVDRCKMMEVRGESMWPYLNNGDIVLVNLDDREIKSGEVYVLVTEEGARVKRLFWKTSGALEIRSDNESPQFPTETLTGDELNGLFVLGRVVWRGG